MNPLARARRFLALGLSVIPVPPPRAGAAPGSIGDGKVPAIAWSRYQSQLPTDAELVEWFPAGAAMNLAIITGAVSGVVVVDADSREAVQMVVRRLPYTAWQVKTARGFHLFYRHTGVRVPNRARIETRDGRQALDVRGDGGYVIAAGSTHATGVEYLAAGDWTAPRSSLPAFWPGWLARRQPTTAPAIKLPRPTGDIVERARRYLASIPRPEIGAGSDNDTLYAACRLTRGFGLDEGAAVALLWEWAGGRPGWSHEWITRKVAHAIRYGSEPIGALR